MGMANRYQPLDIEAKWQKIWQGDRIYETNLTAGSRPDQSKFYAFGMFNYPSGEGIHVGHVKNFTLPDVLLRYKRQLGHAVYAPVGFDSFGLPAENFALKTGTPPRVTTDQAIANYSRQYQACGFGFDWSKMIDTSQPEYYRFTQWCFLQLFQAGLAYQKVSSQWWCELCCTVLADEQVINGKCWRHDGDDDPVIGRKQLKQWFFKTTAYADKLLEATPALDWTDWVKTAQINYIGKSTGAEVTFKLSGLSLSESTLTVFTTAIETIYGATFIVLAPEHVQVADIVAQADNREELEAYIKTAQTKSDVARQQAKEKTGVQIANLTALNPLTNRPMSVWLADYVLASYGTGSIMGVPGADARDLEFAERYNLAVVYPTQADEFVAYKDICADPTRYKLATNDDLNGLDMQQAKQVIFDKLAHQNCCQLKTNFKLRDWLISRQRYWGAPIPIIYCQKCGTVPVPEEQLPVELPPIVDYQPLGDGRSPLAKVDHFVQTQCPRCGAGGQRETDTMDGYVCSSWYQLRYLSPHDANQAWDVELAKTYLPVDFYNGADHATAHLIYARFFTRFFYEQGLVGTPEPFAKMYLHAKILAPDGRFFSKSKGNGINPLDIIEQGYGADALRVYICAQAPPNVETVWDDNGVPAAFRFLSRVWSLVDNYLQQKPATADGEASRTLLEATHRCIAKHNHDLPELKFNTALAAQMQLVNLFYQQAKSDQFANVAWQFCLETLTMLLAPFAPHLASELWQRLGRTDHVHCQHWPVVDEQYLQVEKIHLPVQVNGKLRGEVIVDAHAEEAEVVQLARQLPIVANHLQAGSIKQVVYVPQRILNFVVN